MFLFSGCGKQKTEEILQPETPETTVQQTEEEAKLLPLDTVDPSETQPVEKIDSRPDASSLPTETVKSQTQTGLPEESQPKKEPCHGLSTKFS